MGRYSSEGRSEAVNESWYGNNEEQVTASVDVKD